MPFFQTLDRPSAAKWVRANPHHPVLRPCLYTNTFPTILVVTYMVREEVYHSLVERVGDAFYNVEYREGTFERMRPPYLSELELIKELMRFSSIQEDTDPIPTEPEEQDPC